jgi:uncharacterized protein YndB with AHSA1/START domain
MTLASHDSDIPHGFSEELLLEASIAAVWSCLVNPSSMSGWLGGDDFTVEVDTSWQEGSAIVIRGFHHQHFENKGVVLAFKPHAALSFTHLSSLSRLPDRPSSYTRLSFELQERGDRTKLKFTAAGFPTLSIYKHLHFYWVGTLEVFKHYLEARTFPAPALS